MSQPASLPSIRHSCPGCHQPGRAVSAVTVESLVVPERVARLVSTVGFQFCPTPQCEVAYFNPLSGEVVPPREVRVAIFQKGGDPRRLVCYALDTPSRLSNPKPARPARRASWKLFAASVRKGCTPASAPIRRALLLPGQCSATRARNPNPPRAACHGGGAAVVRVIELMSPPRLRSEPSISSV